MEKIILFISIILFALFLPFEASALQDTYSNEYFSESIFSGIDSETARALEEFGIDSLSSEKIYSVSLSDITEYFSDDLSKKAESCFKFFLQLMSIIIITATVKSYFSFTQKDNLIKIISVVIVALFIVSRLNTLINMLLSTMNACGTFLLCFIPVYTILVSMSGSPGAAITYNSITFAFAQGISGFINNILLNVIGVFFSLSVSFCMNENLNVGRILNIVNKAVNFIIGFLACGFTGLLSIKGITSAAVDAVSSKSVRFLLSSLIPIVGSSISDAYSSLIGSINLIKSSVAIVGILVVLIISIPSVAEGAFYCLSFSLLSYVSEAFELKEISDVIRVFYSGLKLLVLLNVFEVFLLIISTGIMLTVRGG